MITLPIIPYSEPELCSALSDLLAAAPPNLRTVNLFDRKADQGSQDFDDGLGDCSQVYGEGIDDDLGGEEFGP